MPKQSQPQEINNFVAGLISEASPMAFPPNASRDEVNFVLNRDGSRDRRLGMDFEIDWAEISPLPPLTELAELGINTFKWDSVEDDPSKEFIVVQLGNEVHFHDATEASISAAYLGMVHLVGESTKEEYSFSTVDGKLVIATGGADIYIVSFNGIGDFTFDTGRLKIRDFFGVEDITGDGENLYEGNNITIRPTSPSNEHVYNLRNQSWGRKVQSIDPLDDFIATHAVVPSNSDTVMQGLYNDVNDGGKEKFDSQQIFDNPIGTVPAPQGGIIIDALDRGQSRLDELEKIEEINGFILPTVTDLPKDSTPNGASVVEQFAGRVWYAGFSGEVVNGDSKSPRLSSYVLFSKVVDDSSDFFKCYQENDPTSKDLPDILATDGGYVRVSGADKILGLVPVGDSLIVLANNGVWVLSGGSGYGFSADNYLITKVTSFGATTERSIVSIGNEILYWSGDGIYRVAVDQYGSWQATNITANTIQTLFTSVDVDRLRTVKSRYDAYERKVRWLFNTDSRLAGSNQISELVLDVDLGAFYLSRISNLVDNSPEVVDFTLTSAFRSGIEVNPVIAVVGGSVQDVVVSGEPVVITQEVRNAGLRSIKYLTLIPGDTVRYTFSEYRGKDFMDWKSSDGVGADAKGFLLTGANTAGQSQATKQTPYLFVFFRRTEDGVEYDSNNQLIPARPSSCKAQVRWDWSDSAGSNRWSPVFQAYRYKRPYFIEDQFDKYDTGFEIISSRSKLRGRGKALSLYMETEEGKDCRIVGWVLMLNGNSYA